MESEVQKVVEKLEEGIKELFLSDSTGHDFWHLKRVYNLAMHLQKQEGGDELVIALSALLHDMHRFIEIETKKYCLPKDSLPRVKIILESLDIEKEKIDKILYCIEFHEEYGFAKEGKNAKTIESLIIQDADNLDAIGAVGVARAFTYGGGHGVPMWRPNVDCKVGIYDETKNDSSEIHHFYSKLLKLKNNMNTKTAKKMAKQRHKFMEDFLKEFFKEWEGKI